MIRLFAAGAALVFAAAAPAMAAEDWVTVLRTIDVARPASAVWAVYGGYCEFGKVRNVSCVYTRGDGGLGTIRRLANAVEEVKVGESPYSYAYFQTVGDRVNQRYHGNLSVVPSADNKRSRIVYTLIYDQGTLASDAQRAAVRAGLETAFQRDVEKMKATVEGAK